MKFAASLIISLAGAVSTQAGAQTPPAQAPCSGPEHRQLDFWVGEWIATWTKPDGSEGRGRNRVTRDEYGSCVIIERFSADDGSLKGVSISTYFTPAREWRQTWMDDRGGYFDLAGGPVQDQPHSFMLETHRRTASAPFQRMIWEEVTPDGFTWRWQGKPSADAQWRDSWVIRYRRAPAAGGRD